MDEDPDFELAARVLRTIAPERSAALAGEYPHHAEVLVAPGMTLGGSDGGDEAIELDIVPVLYASTLREIGGRTTGALGAAHRRLDGADRLEFYAQIVTLLFGSATLASVFGNSPGVAKVAAVSSVVAGVLSLFAALRRKSIGQDLRSAFAKLARLQAEAASLALRFDVWVDAGGDPTEGKALRVEAHRVIVELEASLPYLEFDSADERL